MRPSARSGLLLILITLILAACGTGPAPAPTGTNTAIPASPTFLPVTVPASPNGNSSPTASPLPQVIQVAVIGDFGSGGSAEGQVATLVHGWKPDIILTVGDDNYELGAADTIDAHIGQYYHDFISPYTGKYGAGADQNRFFPTLGNHDWYTAGAKPYLNYFTLPGNERYYDFTWGPVHFFALDSDANEPDGVNQNSVQAQWLHQALGGSTSHWNVVYFHHPPYSSGMHGSTKWMRWPFAEWGADAVFSGHDHTYERLLVDSIPYFVDGAGGAVLYSFGNPLPETQFRYNTDHGAVLLTASETELLVEFYNHTGTLIDSYRQTKP